MTQSPGKADVDYLILGHITQDITDNGTKVGGTAAYASLLAYRLGWEVGLVTAYNDDNPLQEFDGIQIVNRPTERPTTFENRYTPSGRQQRLLHRAPPLPWSHIPAPWRFAPIVHLAPVAQELDPEMMVKFPKSFVGASLQGWLRRWDRSGRVQYAPLAGSLQDRPRPATVVLSYEDVAGDRGRIQRYAQTFPLLLATRGRDGAEIYQHGKVVHIPTTPQPERDPTGAGDIFASAFFIHYATHHDPINAAHFATSLAALSVTREGLEGVPTREELHSLKEVF